MPTKGAFSAVPQRYADIAIKVNFEHSPVLSAVFQSQASSKFLMGPIGSGKTVECLTELLQWSSEQEPGDDGYRSTIWAVVRNTQKQLKTATIATLKQIVSPMLGNVTYIATVPMSCTIDIPPVWNADGSLSVPGIKILYQFFALDNDAQAADLLSYECTGIYWNEAREISKSIIDLGNDRTGRFPSKLNGPGATNAPILYDTNPPDTDSYIYEWFMNMPDGLDMYVQPPGVLEVEYDVETQTYRCIESGYAEVRAESIKQPHRRWVKDDKLTYADIVLPPALHRFVVRAARKFWIANPAADNLMNHRIEKRSDPLKHPYGKGCYYLRNISTKSLAYIRSYYQNRFAAIGKGDPVIPEFDVTRQTVDQPVIKGLDIYCGVDIGGGTLNPAIVFAQVLTTGNVVVVGELHLPNTGAQTFIKAVKMWWNLHGRGNRIAKLWLDPSARVKDAIYERQIVSYFIQAGFNDVALAPTVKIEPRLDSIKSRCRLDIDGYPGLLLSRDCIMLSKGLAGGWSFKKTGTKLTPDKGRYSHICDALGYLLAGLDGNVGYYDDTHRHEPVQRVQVTRPRGPK